LRDENDQLRSEILKLQSGLEEKIAEDFRIEEFEGDEEYKLLLKQLKLIKDQSLSNEISITIVSILENIKFHYNQMKKNYSNLLQSQPIKPVEVETIKALKESAELSSRLKSSLSHHQIIPYVQPFTTTENPFNYPPPLMTTVSSVRRYSPILGPTWITHQKFPY
jgi:hypothetical protein